MKILPFIALVFLFTSKFSISQNIFHDTLPNNSQELIDKLNGILFIDFGLNEEQQEVIINNSTSGESIVLSALADFLVSDFNYSVIISNQQRIESRIIANSICDYAILNCEIGDFVSKLGAVGYYPISLIFKFCDNSIYQIDTMMNVNGLTNYTKKLKSTFRNMLTFKREYDIDNRLPIIKEEIILKEKDFNSYFLVHDKNINS